MRQTSTIRQTSALAGLALAFTLEAGAQDTWTATSTVGAPTARESGHTAVWTGSRVIVHGGYSGATGTLNTGGQYDPAANTWTATSTTGAIGRALHSAVWTGTRMIVWGGHVAGLSVTNTGGAYDPVSNTWTATSTVAAPGARNGHTAVWTGSRMIVWGGFDGGFLNTGGIYDPATNSWTATSTVGAPVGRSVHTAVWTGSRMIVWGGSNLDTGETIDSGGIYDPGTDTWTPTSAVNAPSARVNHTAVWTGSRMIVWGGRSKGVFPATVFSTGGIYDPANNTWTATSLVGQPTVRYAHAAVWTGSRMIVWGGGTFTNQALDTGRRYDPASDTWTPTTSTGVPAARMFHSAVWTGTRMVVFGGWNGTAAVNTGGVYDPNFGSVLSISDAAVSEGAAAATATFTVTLSPASGQSATVNYATADGTATAPADYLVASGTLTFAPGETTKQVSVTVNGDALDEADETFFVNLTNPTNAAIADGQGLGTIHEPVEFHTSSPCRILDTRNPNGPLGGPILSPGQQRSFTVTGGACVVPSTAKAVSVNLTVVNPTAAGFVTVFPGDGSLPSTSSINFSAGQIRANNGVFRLAGDGTGRLNIVNGSSGSTHVLLDVNGYFE